MTVWTAEASEYNLSSVFVFLTKFIIFCKEKKGGQGSQAHLHWAPVDGFNGPHSGQKQDIILWSTLQWRPQLFQQSRNVPWKMSTR